MMSRLTSLSVVFAGLGGLFAAGCSSSQVSTRPPQAAVGPGPHAFVAVRVPLPWYAPRFVVRRKFRDAVPEYESIGPLLAKYFTISDDGQFGGLYLWATRDDAERHFDTKWRADVRQRRGADADLLLLDAPYVVNGPALPRGAPTGTRSQLFPAWASLVRWKVAERVRVPQAAEWLSRATWSAPELARGFVLTGSSEVGVAAVWTTRRAAERAASEAERASVGASLGATTSSAWLFEAPVLIDASLRTVE